MFNHKGRCQKHPEGGGCIFFLGGVDHIHLFWGECIRHSTNFFFLGGGLFEFQSDLGGSAVFTEKSQNGGSVHIFHQIWRNYRVKALSDFVTF